jgi:hypothetical protein
MDPGKDKRAKDVSQDIRHVPPCPTASPLERQEDRSVSGKVTNLAQTGRCSNGEAERGWDTYLCPAIDLPTCTHPHSAWERFKGLLPQMPNA